MTVQAFPVIDLVATGRNIQFLRRERGLTVKDLQDYFGFEAPQAIYRWQYGKTLPTVDNLFALSRLLQVPMEQILVPAADSQLYGEKQQEVPAASAFFGRPRKKSPPPGTVPGGGFCVTAYP